MRAVGDAERRCEATQAKYNGVNEPINGRD